MSLPSRMSFLMLAGTKWAGRTTEHLPAGVSGGGICSCTVDGVSVGGSGEAVGGRASRSVVLACTSVIVVESVATMLWSWDTAADMECNEVRWVLGPGEAGGELFEAGGGKRSLKSSAFLAVDGKGTCLRLNSAVNLGMVHPLKERALPLSEAGGGEEGAKRSSLPS